VFIRGGDIVIQRGPHSRTPANRSLENWLRKQARDDIQQCLTELTSRLKRRPNRVYVMNQRTKWGNCSARRNLSLNWRLILAPREVLQYLVAHEAAHLAVPDHSDRFWLLLQSICPHARRSRRWLADHGHTLLGDAVVVR
jgi:predicted metal-dependent hydrolase